MVSMEQFVSESEARWLWPVVAGRLVGPAVASPAGHCPTAMATRLAIAATSNDPLDAVGACLSPAIQAQAISVPEMLLDPAAAR